MDKWLNILASVLAIYKIVRSLVMCDIRVGNSHDRQSTCTQLRISTCELFYSNSKPIHMSEMLRTVCGSLQSNKTKHHLQMFSEKWGV